jgi:hypothetical protein
MANLEYPIEAMLKNIQVEHQQNRTGETALLKVDTSGD